MLIAYVALALHNLCLFACLLLSASCFGHFCTLARIRETLVVFILREGRAAVRVATAPKTLRLSVILIGDAGVLESKSRCIAKSASIYAE